MVIAHRGASAYAPENTCAAFDLAIRMGVRHIELDVQPTGNGHIAVIHDATVDRTTDGSGPVASCTWAVLHALDAGSWFSDAFKGERIPEFEEILLRYRYQGLLHLHAEIKSRTPSFALQVADAVLRHGMAEQVTMTSFYQEPLQEIRAFASHLQTAWLVEAIDAEVIAEAHALGCAQLCPPAAMLTPEMVQLLHAERFIIRAWGVKSENLMRQVVLSGADGMTVDFPDKLIAYLRNHACPFA